MKGFKVVNYNEWSSLPDIFTTMSQAKRGLESWKYSRGAVIESFNQKVKFTRTVFYNKKEIGE